MVFIPYEIFQNKKLLIKNMAWKLSRDRMQLLNGKVSADWLTYNYLCSSEVFVYHVHDLKNESSVFWDHLWI